MHRKKPAGVWSYGYSLTLGSPLILHTANLVVGSLDDGALVCFPERYALPSYPGLRATPITSKNLE